MEEEADRELVQENTRIEHTKLELTVDEALENYVGSLGPSQLLHVFIVSMAWIFDSQHTLVTIFSDSQPSWRCKTYAINGHDCFDRTHNHGGSVCGLKPGTWEWREGNSSSTIAEYGLICNRKFLAAIPTSLFFIGSLLGSVVYGRLADGYLGRKGTLALSCILASVTAFLTSFSPNVSVYSILRFANGFARSGIGICCLVLSTEAVGRKWRGQVGQYGFFFFTAGFLALPLIGYHTRRNWRNLYRVISYLPLAYSLLLLPFVSESPRWLLVKGRSNEALNVLKKLAKRNGRRVPDNLSLLDPSMAKNTPANQASRGSEHSENLWTTKWAAKRMIIVMLTGFGVGFVYYGVQLNIENLNFNLYLSVAINAVMEIPAVFIGSVLLGLMNRRLLLSLFAFLAGVFSILCIIFNHKKEQKSSQNWLELSVEAIGFMAASAAFDVLYIYCIELFPTNVRNFAVSPLRQALMLGASVAPVLVVLGRLSPKLSFLIFGLFSVLSGALSLLLPETRNAPLYETLKQQEEEEKLKSAKDGAGLEN